MTFVMITCVSVILSYTNDHILTRTSSLSIKRQISRNSIFYIAFYVMFLLIFYHVPNIFPARFFHILAIFLSPICFFSVQEVLVFYLLVKPVKSKQISWKSRVFNNRNFFLLLLCFLVLIDFIIEILLITAMHLFENFNSYVSEHKRYIWGHIFALVSDFLI